MPPYYGNQFPGQYPNDPRYYDQYRQYDGYQYQPPPQQASSQRVQPIPPFSSIQVNIPAYSPQSQTQPQSQSHAHQIPQPQQQQQQQQYHHVQQYQQSYAQPYNQEMNYNAYQNHQQPQYMPQYQPQPVTHHQQYHQAMPQQPPQAVQQPVIQQRVLQDVQVNASRQPTAAKPPPPPQIEEREPDYAIVLLGLADEYLEASTKISSRSEMYYKLTATALGCIQSVLTNFKLPPLREAQVSLKYAQLLYNETQNYDDAESVLTKTVEICERMKFIDLKYAAQLLLAKVLHQSSPRAAMKDLERMIEDIEAYKHVAWEYAFRLQYAMFLTAAGTSSDIHGAILQLEKIGAVARKHDDNVIYAFAAIFEAFTYLRSSSTDAITSSQNALAKARSVQLNSHILGNSQMMIMMEFVDLCASIKSFDIAQSEQKRKSMQQPINQALENPDGWRSDGLMYIPLKSSSLRGVSLQEGGIIMERNNAYFLTFQWLSLDETEDIGYLLCGISAASKRTGSAEKTEKFLDAGLDTLRDIMKDKRTVNHAGDTMHNRRQLMECHFLLERSFFQCSKGEWDKADASVNNIVSVAKVLGDEFPVDMQCLVDYLRGSIAQGRGELLKALEIYSLPHLQIQLPPSGSSTSGRQFPKQSEVMRDVSILVCINTIFIIQNPSHPYHHRLQQLVNILDPLAHGSPNKMIQSAYNFVLASLPNNTILKTKQYLAHALHAAQAICNAQITTLCLVTMQEKFFKGVRGDQAIKCAKAATHQAKRLNEPLWISVATGLESECLSIHFLNEDATRKREEAAEKVKVLPIAVQKATMTN